MLATTLLLSIFNLANRVVNFVALAIFLIPRFFLIFFLRYNLFQ